MTLEHCGTILAKKRSLSSKGYLNNARKNGEIPAILYGKIDGLDENIPLILHFNSVEKILKDPSVLTKPFALKIDEGKSHSVYIKEIQFHPVKSSPIHVDFIEVGKKSVVSCIVPIRVVNTERCEQIKRGGVIVMLNYNIRVLGGASEMVKTIDIDAENLKIGDIIFTGDCSLPKGCSFEKSNIPLLKMTGKRVVEGKDLKVNAGESESKESKAEGKEGKR